jgi:hypothetical protein
LQSDVFPIVVSKHNTDRATVHCAHIVAIGVSFNTTQSTTLTLSHYHTNNSPHFATQLDAQPIPDQIPDQAT